jgi:hypothetical protein
MPIDIDRFSEAELMDLNRRIVERLRLMQQARAHQAMLQFRIGERVWFHNELGERVDGVIVRYNRKSVSLVTEDGQQWRVGPRLLHKAGDDVIESTAVHVPPLPKT